MFLCKALALFVLLKTKFAAGEDAQCTDGFFRIPRAHESRCYYVIKRTFWTLKDAVIACQEKNGSDAWEPENVGEKQGVWNYIAREGTKRPMWVGYQRELSDGKWWKYMSRGAYREIPEIMWRMLEPSYEKVERNSENFVAVKDGLLLDVSQNGLQNNIAVCQASRCKTQPANGETEIPVTSVPDAMTPGPVIPGVVTLQPHMPDTEIPDTDTEKPDEQYPDDGVQTPQPVYTVQPNYPWE
ncbi:uncharacterized protein LOC142351953 [Convolutriloba macropyga]|uniref:uncharacterized protein LOC142351953 n=1 Tax=Convolutriloba macropyga TaxID=536237 RepID=UPI003F51F8D4